MTMTRLSCILLLVTFLFFPLTLPAAELSGVVSWIDDGDTIEVRDIGTVRLLGIDTPEMQASPRDDFYTQSFGLRPSHLRTIARQAKRYLISKVKGRYVKLELGSPQKDKYDRYLAYVYLENGEMLNRILIEQGYASTYRRYSFEYKKDFLKTEKAAKSSAIGLWKHFK
jgi:micrococcal nuclease